MVTTRTPLKSGFLVDFGNADRYATVEALSNQFSNEFLGVLAVSAPDQPPVRGRGYTRLTFDERHEQVSCSKDSQIELVESLCLAQEEARLLNHNYIGTEHILLGLIHEGEGVAAKALESLGISLEAVRNQVEEIIGQGGTSRRAGTSRSPRAPRRCSS